MIEHAELPPRLLQHLVNVTTDEVIEAVSAVVRNPSADLDAPDAFGLGVLPQGVVVVVYDGEAPARPDGAIRVYWIGPIPPGTSVTVPGDLWFNTFGME